MKGSRWQAMGLCAGALLTACAQGAGPTFVQSALHNNGSLDRPTCTAAFPTTNAAGNLIVVGVEVGSTAAAHHVVVHDTQGNTYLPAAPGLTWREDGGGSFAQIFYAANIRPGSNTVSMTEPNEGGTGAGNAFNQVSIHEYSGLSIAGPLDASAGLAGVTVGNPFTISSGVANTRTNGELIFGYGNAIDIVPTAGTGFTLRQTGAGTSEDQVQAGAGPVAATEKVTMDGALYVMLMGTFYSGTSPAAGPVLPAQPNVVLNPGNLLALTNAAAERNTNAPSTTTLHFAYADRPALLADGWNFFATNAAGLARNTEVTNPANGALVSYDQASHPGRLLIPCDLGNLLLDANDSRNTLFRSLPTNWLSLRLLLTFNPTNDYQETFMAVYQDDDHYVEVGLGYNSDLFGEAARLLAEDGGDLTSLFTDTIWYTGGPGSAPVTNLYLRLDRVGGTGVNAFNSLDGRDWAFIGSASQPLRHPRVAIWVGGSSVPYANGSPVCELERLDIITANPPPAITYQLLNPPTGATIDTNGTIHWAPSPGQSPSTNVLKTVATDNRSTPLKATNSVTVTVLSLPAFPNQTNRVISELTTLTVTNAATDANGPLLTLTYALLDPPPGASISTDGVITWTPTEAQGPGTNLLTTVATDNAVPPQSGTNTFVVVVREVNLAPVLPVTPPDVVVVLGATLVVTNAGTDDDLPPNPLSYQLLGAPAGAIIDTNGVIRFTPAAPGTNQLTTVVTDSSPGAVNAVSLSATNRFTVVVLPPPQVASFSLSGNLFALTWTAVTGQTYRVQYKDDLFDTNWRTVTPDVVAAGPTAGITNDSTGAPQRFYRVVLLP